jgi:hypothetical protein
VHELKAGQRPVDAPTVPGAEDDFEAYDVEPGEHARISRRTFLGGLLILGVPLVGMHDVLHGSSDALPAVRDDK